MFVHLNFNKCILFSGQIIPVFLKFSIVYFFTVLTHNTSNDYFRSLQMNNTKKFVNLLKDIFSYTENEEYNFSLSNEDTSNIQETEQTEYNDIFSTLSVNLEYMKSKYNSLISNDIKFREFKFNAQDKEYNAFIVYIDGMVNSDAINDFILKPLMILNKGIKPRPLSTAITNNITVKKVKKFNLEEYILNSLIPQNDITKISEFNDIISDINSGNCALFVDTLPISFSLDVKGFKHRSVSEPQNEVVVKGSQEAFVEVLRVNTSILRRLVNSENLIVENSTVGKISQTKIAVCYLKNIANNDLVGEVKYRINNLDIDSIISSGQLEQLIQDNGNTSFPQIISTERPDKVANLLFEGRVAIIVNGSPYVLVAPGIFVDFISSPEDLNLKHQFSNVLRIIRLIAMFFALLLPGLYISTTTYHSELIPTELLFAIASSRESVPFPIIFEILIMEISFELIREAGLRVPSPIGPTIGIVGALILGDAAVSASIVSPILIIIVAITGICSFAVPNYELSFTLRFLRFIFLFLGYIAGYLGIVLGLLIYICILANLKSFGVPYLAPYVPSETGNNTDTFFVHPIWFREKRASFLDTKKPIKENNISMVWKKYSH